MKHSLLLCLLTFAAVPSLAAPKPHVITFGKWSSAHWLTGAGDDKALSLKIRGLFVDGRLKEFTTGLPHEITDRLFVVRRIFRVNDSLPEDPPSLLRWQWQRGGWLLVDRTTGRLSALNLPEFDALYSSASWYRDYAAYCGVSDDGKKLFAVVAQINRRKPVLKKPLSGDGIGEDAAPDSACVAPAWQRSPVQVSFTPPVGAKQTYAVRGHIVDVVVEEEQEAEGSQ